MKQLSFPQLQLNTWKWDVRTWLQPPPRSSATVFTQGSNSQTPCEHKGWLSLTLEEKGKGEHLFMKGRITEIMKKPLVGFSKRCSHYQKHWAFSWQKTPEYYTYKQEGWGGIHLETVLCPQQLHWLPHCLLVRWCTQHHVTSWSPPPCVNTRWQYRRYWFCDIWSGFYYPKGSTAGHRSG